MPIYDNMLPTSDRRRNVDAALVGALLYFAFAVATILLTSDGKSHATVWLADAAILAVLLSRPKSDWPAALLLGWAANLAANSLTREWAPGIILYGGINMAQILLAALVLRRYSERPDLLSDATTAFNFIFWAGLIAPAAGAIAGSAVSVVNYGEEFLPSLTRWYSSNALGFVILTPFLKSWFDGSCLAAIRMRLPRRRLEDAALLLFHCLVSGLTFSQSGLPLLFAPLCSLLLLAFRSGRLATQAGVVLVGIFGALAAIYHSGPVALVHRGPVFEAIFFQTYLAVMLAIALPVAALVASRSEALADAARREELLGMILDHSPDAILSFDADGNCQSADGATEELFGLQADACRNASMAELSVSVSPVLFDLSIAARAKPSTSHVADFFPANLPSHTAEASVKAVLSEERVVGTVAIVRDVTRRRARERAIARLALCDPLTKVANRAGFDAELMARRMVGEPMCVALIDIDNFKSINDRFGHQTGDRVLEEVAAAAARLAGDDHFVARLGGDEFVMLLASDIRTGHQILERLRETVAHLSVVPGLRMTICSGIAEMAIDAEAKAALESADRRLYAAKQQGRNRTNAIAD